MSPAPLRHPSTPLRHALAVVATAVALAPLGAGAQPLPGSARVSQAEAASGYAKMVRDGVDSTFRRWERAAAAGDAAALGREYMPGAVVYPTHGTPMHGRQALMDAFARVLPRLSAPRLVVERLTASGDLVSVVAELSYQVALAAGGAYERRERVQLAMRPVWNAGWLIELQSGGDLVPTVEWTKAPPKRLAVGTGDSVRVRVLDALGGGVGDVLVAFDAMGATVTPATARTDARGQVAAWIEAGPHTGFAEVRATAASAPEDALLVAIVTVPGAPAEVRVARDDAPDAVRVEVVDRFGNPVPDAEVRLALAQGDGSVAPTTVRTDSGGRATARVVAGAGDAGARVVTATVEGLPAARLELAPGAAQAQASAPAVPRSR